MTALDRFLATLDPDRSARALELLTLAPEELLLVGGDDRQLPRAGTGRNGYGLPIVDREPVVRGSSCTATPPDAVALADVAAWSSGVARALTTAGRLPSADTFHEEVASRIAAHLGLDATHTERIVLAPSGTDSESIATGLVLAANDRPLCNIVLGAAESGSGIVPAALGRYFARRTPFRGDVETGEPITGLDPDRVRLVNVELRDRRGRARRAFDVEAEVEAHIEDALDRGEQVLVHAMAGSKTDLRQLSSDWVRVGGHAVRPT